MSPLANCTIYSRHDAGHYRCMAENGFGREPVTKEVKMEVHRKYFSILSSWSLHLVVTQNTLPTCEGKTDVIEDFFFFFCRSKKMS